MEGGLELDGLWRLLPIQTTLWSLFCMPFSVCVVKGSEGPINYPVWSLHLGAHRVLNRKQIHCTYSESFMNTKTSQLISIRQRHLSLLCSNFKCKGISCILVIYWELEMLWTLKISKRILLIYRFIYKRPSFKIFHIFYLICDHWKCIFLQM